MLHGFDKIIFVHWYVQADTFGPEPFLQVGNLVQGWDGMFFVPGSEVVGIQNQGRMQLPLGDGKNRGMGIVFLYGFGHGCKFLLGDQLFFVFNVPPPAIFDRRVVFVKGWV